MQHAHPHENSAAPPKRRAPCPRTSLAYHRHRSIFRDRNTETRGGETLFRSDDRGPRPHTVCTDLKRRECSHYMSSCCNGASPPLDKGSPWNQTWQPASAAGSIHRSHFCFKPSQSQTRKSHLGAEWILPPCAERKMLKAAGPQEARVDTKWEHCVEFEPSGPRLQKNETITACLPAGLPSSQTAAS